MQGREEQTSELGLHPEGSGEPWEALSRGWQRGKAYSGGKVKRGKRQRKQRAAMRPELRQWLEKGEEGTDSRARLELVRSREEVSSFSTLLSTTWSESPLSDTDHLNSSLESGAKGQEEEQCERERR